MKPKSVRRLAVLFLLLSQTAVGAGWAEDGVTALRCGRLLDPASGSVTEGAVVLVRGGRIEAVGKGRPCRLGRRASISPGTPACRA